MCYVFLLRKIPLQRKRQLILVFYLFIYSARMDTYVDVIFNYGGKWEVSEKDVLCYVNSDVDTVYNFDPDFMCYGDIIYRYNTTLGFTNMKNVFVLELGKSLRDGLFLVNDDDSIRRVLNYIRDNSWVGEIELYVDHEVDSPHFVPQILAIDCHSVEEEAPVANEGSVDNNADGFNAESEVHNTSNVDEVNAPYVEVNTFADPINENAEAGTQFSCNNVGGVGCSEEVINTTYIPPNGYVSE